MPPGTAPLETGEAQDAPREDPAPEAAPGTETVATSAEELGRPATIRDVAALARVSHQTVHRFLQGYEGIRPATRERVVEALAALEYRPNLTARSLTTGRSMRIGALTHELDQFGPSKIIQGAAQAARDAGYVLDILSLDMGDPDEIDRALQTVTQHDLAGVLALASTDHMAQAFGTANFRVPAFLAGEEDEFASDHPSQLTSVGFPALIDHLAELGHRRLLHLAGPSAWSAARNRARAFEAAVAAHGLVSAGVVHGDWTARSGHEVVSALPSSLDFTAVVAANDQMALGALLALRERDLRVPEDMSITGVDDIPDAAYFSPPLTTLRVDFVAQGRRAVEHLLARIAGREPEDDDALISQLVVRRSTDATAR
ncbi:LacI family transcriptional regulator [Promicromonospora sp. AC04]|uniref:LacI family DNA-binding transcriptional regulator n=1 Tax=Promicromonospora sp. AC04 TaxID=2135723 RepID=UPI000D3CB82A|nr:substrate-binding domain-containing protein [Promicromonospora sp. AC04]PUB24797.1 LacI family transcriptional regulator [Promicromonospora sp. AC04]